MKQKKSCLNQIRYGKKLDPNMMAEDDLLFSNLREIYREGIPKRSSQSHKLKVQKNFTPSSQKLEAKNLLVTPKNYLRELFGVTNCGILQI